VESLADVAAEKNSLAVNLNGAITTLTIRRGERPFHFGLFHTVTKNQHGWSQVKEPMGKSKKSMANPTEWFHWCLKEARQTTAKTSRGRCANT
jgi:hypothetical protein